MQTPECPLLQKRCLPCEGEVSALNSEKQQHLLSEIDSSWRIEKGHHLEKEYIFTDFRQALSFTNHIGELAEREGHHPDIYLSWGKVKVLIWTHAINGLSENDFILAAKCDEENTYLFRERACF